MTKYFVLSVQGRFDALPLTLLDVGLVVHVGVGVLLLLQALWHQLS